MSNLKISELTPIVALAGPDEMPIVDKSANETKKLTLSQLDARYLAGLTALTGDVTASGAGSQPATVVSVGGQSAANVARAARTLQSISASLLNNQGVASSISGLSFDKAVVKGATISFCVDRRTDASNKQIVGTISIVHDAADDQWRITWFSSMDEDDTLFSITSAGQIQYTTENLAGSSYQGSFYATVTNIFL